MPIDANEQKRLAAVAAVADIQDGMILGLGTGSTVAHALDALAVRVRAGLKVVGVPSSLATEHAAARLGIPLTTLERAPALDLTIDGADEVDPTLDLIKGAGGALLREKVLAGASHSLAIMVDASKLVSRLGSRYALPVEVVPFAVPVVQARLAALGLGPSLRRRDGQPVQTDNGNAIVDCATGPIADARQLDAVLHAVPGVVDHGLFLGMTSAVYVARPDGTVCVYRAGEPPAW